MSNTNDAVKHIVATIFAAQKALQDLAPEGRWRGLGNLLGDYGEFIGLHHYGLTRVGRTASGYDALTKEGRRVQIKANYSSPTIGLRGEADLLLVLRIESNGEWKELYFGPFDPIRKIARYSERDNKYMVPIRRLEGIGESRGSNPDS